MTWHYQIRKRIDKGEVLYDIVEVYEGIEPNEKRTWTQDSMAPISETRRGMIHVLEMMLRDAKRWPTLIVKEEV